MADTPPPDAGAGQQGQQGQQHRGTDRRPKDRESIAAQVRRMAERRGGFETLAVQLMDELLDSRERGRSLKQQLEQLRAPGSAVLTKADADELTAWRGLGTKVEDVKKQLGEHATLQAEVAGLKQNDVARQAAAMEPYGYAPDVLADLMRTKGLTLTIGEVEVVDEKGQKLKKPAALVRPDGKPLSEAVELAGYVEQHLKQYLPALAPAVGSGSSTPPATGRGTPSAVGTPWPVQQGPASSSRVEVKDEEIAKEMRATGAYTSL